MAHAVKTKKESQGDPVSLDVADLLAGVDTRVGKQRLTPARRDAAGLVHLTEWARSIAALKPPLAEWSEDDTWAAVERVMKAVADDDLSRPGLLAAKIILDLGPDPGLEDVIAWDTRGRTWRQLANIALDVELPNFHQSLGLRRLYAAPLFGGSTGNHFSDHSPAFRAVVAELLTNLETEITKEIRSRFEWVPAPQPASKTKREENTEQPGGALLEPLSHRSEDAWLGREADASTDKDTESAPPSRSAQEAAQPVEERPTPLSQGAGKAPLGEKVDASVEPKLSPTSPHPQDESGREAPGRRAETHVTALAPPHDAHAEVGKTGTRWRTNVAANRRVVLGAAAIGALLVAAALAVAALGTYRTGFGSSTGASSQSPSTRDTTAPLEPPKPVTNFLQVPTDPRCPQIPDRKMVAYLLVTTEGGCWSTSVAVRTGSTIYVLIGWRDTSEPLSTNVTAALSIPDGFELVPDTSYWGNAIATTGNFIRGNALEGVGVNIGAYTSSANAWWLTALRSTDPVSSCTGVLTVSARSDQNPTPAKSEAQLTITGCD